jgi:ankyrin repeat protein
VLGDVDRVEKAISKGANINAVDEDFGDTPLVKAVINCHKDVVALLLRCEARIDVVNRAGETALPIAERDSTPEIARMLRAHSEALAAGLDKAPVAWADRGEELWFWAGEGGVDMGDGLDYATSNSLACAEVTKLLDAGINVDARDAESNETALMAAATCGAAGVVKLLLARGADPREIDSYGSNSLHRAASGGHREVVDMLIGSQKLEREKLKLVEGRDRVGVTAAEKAMRAGHDAIARTLLALGVQGGSPHVGPQSPTARQALDQLLL